MIEPNRRLLPCAALSTRLRFGDCWRRFMNAIHLNSRLDSRLLSSLRVPIGCLHSNLLSLEQFLNASLPVPLLLELLGIFDTVPQITLLASQFLLLLRQVARPGVDCHDSGLFDVGPYCVISVVLVG